MEKKNVTKKSGCKAINESHDGERKEGEEREKKKKKKKKKNNGKKEEEKMEGNVLRFFVLGLLGRSTLKVD